MTPGFAITDYKVQGATFKEAVLDLRRKSVDKTKNSHKTFCSTYVQLSRLQSLEGLHLLEPIELNDINNFPDPNLSEASRFFDQLSQNTLNSWMLKFESRR